MVAMFSAINCGPLSRLESIATPCPVKAYGAEGRPNLRSQSVISSPQIRRIFRVSPVVLTAPGPTWRLDNRYQ
jgi:hypothetical protein